MKYYAACTQKEEISATTLFPPFNILCSYHYFKNKKELIKECISNGFDVFIDSGAFSAMNSGSEIDIDEYCKFLIETKAVYYASLDVIGNAKETMVNYKYMIEHYGLKPIPAFHMGSDLKDLEPLLESNYIALGGLVASSGILNHCDLVWDFILKNKPDLKVHGFGLTNIELMGRYPWYSVDSSSYNSCKRYGRQSVIYNNLDFSTFTEDEYQEILKKIGFEFKESEDKKEITELNKKKYFLYDFFSCQSYKMYAAHLTEINKIKKFDYLTNQQKLF